MRQTMMRILLASACCWTATAQAQGAPDAAGDSDRFSLGQIIVTAPRTSGIEIDGSTLSSDAIYSFNRTSLDDAVNLMPGVSAGNSGGTRNERLVFVRGFDRFQVPLSIDGIRVYLPADNRLDYGRFLTTDIAEVQVAKGYASVLDGPGAMGGAINLVTSKPTKALDIDLRGQVSFDNDMDYAGYTTSAKIGTRHDLWYAQASYARSFTDHWDLPNDFTPRVSTLEDGGARDFSRAEDWRVNAKLGFTPNATDEYALSYTHQEGSKSAPLHISDTVTTARFWDWPSWDITSVYFLSTTALGDRATLKTRAYYNQFDSMLRSFNDRTQTAQSRPYAFDSPYEDKAWGGSAQLDFTATDADTLRLAFHYRHDEHVEFQTSFSMAGVATTEPKQTQSEATYSIALENELALSPTLRFTLGGSYDWRNLERAEEYGAPLGTSGTPSVIYNYPRRDADTWNAQGRFDWQASDALSLHASLSSRARFPTIFERFSQRFNTAIPNPDLKAERATNAEIGGSWSQGSIRLEGALFYSWVRDAIFSVPTPAYPCTASTTPPAVPTAGCALTNLSQSRNVGKGEYYGIELSASATLLPGLDAGINYTGIKRDLTDPSNARFRPTGVPTHKGFAYLDWAPVERLHIVPSVDLASNRWTLFTATPASQPARYDRTGAYVNASLRVDLALTDQIDLSIGGRNLFDDYYTLTDGFPEPGRTVYASARFRY
ncbi:TonB-dependent receptor plug domain-containing protein [Sphingobium yanoikuyae]|uniref:TonB-dependent receptor n=1 Tax=Sphingobium yanoikuyae TaxID=13690 RepID=A0A085KA04_SPHYA|nr:TonB-dependent receptor [Sphingobium yanoikuyae]AYO77527.1 TonB-dependent receptor [Sphingobium yanoikuyae]KFD29550.1 TonB-dependent receptor [Sphingobium yanoikuyae]KZC80284.1 TonB-dependent receptor [Sphingobium yanoikuyae]MDV3479109.1 TonB-dependent receptor [Sphingobium yanoikuyae]